MEMIMSKYSRSHIGATFNNGNMLVVDGSTKSGYVKVKCSTCAEDSELFGDGVFEVRFRGLEQGYIPCGCGKAHRWSLSQYAIRIKRIIVAKSLDIEFLGFGKSGSVLRRTSVRLFCNSSRSEYEVSTISSFLAGIGNQGKNFSGGERMDRYNLENLNHCVWDTGKKSTSHSVFGFYCKVCDNNGFDSVFEIVSNSLFKGHIPCYCSGTKKNISGDHIVENCRREVFQQRLNGVEVIGAYKKKSYWYPVFLCDIHGVYSRRYGTGCHCLKCNPPLTGYDKTKQGSLYLLEIQTDSGTILGYGITNNINNRLTTHLKNLKELGYKILSTRVFEGSGTKVLAVENSIKTLHKTGLIDCEGFRRESISIDRKEEVLGLCAGLKEIVHK